METETETVIIATERRVARRAGHSPMGEWRPGDLLREVRGYTVPEGGGPRRWFRFVQRVGYGPGWSPALVGIGWFDHPERPALPPVAVLRDELVARYVALDRAQGTPATLEEAEAHLARVRAVIAELEAAVATCTDGDLVRWHTSLILGGHASVFGRAQILVDQKRAEAEWAAREAKRRAEYRPWSVDDYLMDDEDGEVGESWFD